MAKNINSSFKDIVAKNDANRLANEVRSVILRYEDERNRALAEARKTRDEVRAEVLNEYEEENKRLKRRLKYAVGFLNSDKELNAFIAFCIQHASCRAESKIDSGKMPYITQYGTGISIHTKAHCQVCGASEDITDTEAW